MNLEPCPFCESRETFLKSWMGSFVVRCYGCDAWGPVCGTRKEAIEAWNTRASPPIVHDEPVLDVNGKIIYTLRTVRI